MGGRSVRLASDERIAAKTGPSNEVQTMDVNKPNFWASIKTFGRGRLAQPASVGWYGGILMVEVCEGAPVALL